jgi:hypothetical protein
LWSLGGNDNKSPSAQSGPGPRPGPSIDADVVAVRVRHGARRSGDAARRRRLGQPARREHGAGRHVFFYDPGIGQVGRLDAATSRFTKAQPAAAWVAPGGGGHIAARGNTTWIVTGLATVERIDGSTLAEVGAVPIDAPGATDTWVAAGADRGSRPARSARPWS